MQKKLENYSYQVIWNPILQKNPGYFDEDYGIGDFHGSLIGGSC